VSLAKLRWRILRGYQELKDELGLGHNEGHNWRGFHHHSVLCIAAYAFLAAERGRLAPLRLQPGSAVFRYPGLHPTRIPRPTRARHNPASITTQRAPIAHTLVQHLPLPHLWYQPSRL
jgi:hypothetical protein